MEKAVGHLASIDRQLVEMNYYLCCLASGKPATEDGARVVLGLPPVQAIPEAAQKAPKRSSKPKKP